MVLCHEKDFVQLETIGEWSLLVSMMSAMYSHHFLMTGSVLMSYSFSESCSWKANNWLLDLSKWIL